MLKLLHHATAERIGWFGAGLGVAAVGVVGYQLIVASLLFGPLPGPQPAPVAATPFATRTPFPTRTPNPTRTPYPTRTRTPAPTRVAPDLLGTALSEDPNAVAAAVATVAARTSEVVASLQATPGRH